METKAMKELHEIREKIYEETKDMSTHDFLKYIHKEADEAKKRMKELKTG
ncbi:MAG TPA: hypothetical protein GXX35_04540 [Thermoanaerobacterales bacterium]|nr:hypothetical protein [Thermoanaerobacterales bacterium]